MILTNNSKLRDHPEAHWVEGEQNDVLLKARDLIQKGHKLLTSPLAASGRMHFSPVRSIIVSDETGAADPESVMLIEDGLAMLKTALSKHVVDHRNLEGYEVIDYELLTVALNEIDELDARYQNTGGK